MCCGFTSASGSARVSIGRRILIILTVMALTILGTALCQSLTCEEAHAIEIVGYLNDKAYGDFEALYEDLEDDYADKTVEITMAENWNAGDNSDFDHRLIIPKNCKATLEMWGFMFDRRLSRTNDWAANGELICIRNGASLTINGNKGSSDAWREHTTKVYSSNASDNKAAVDKTFHGGVLAGGCSYGGGGGIHVERNATVILNNVTIAGCRAEAVWYTGFMHGLGGAIYLTDADTTLKLKNSTITGNYSSSGGGGICTNVGKNVKIEMDGSHVDYNYSGSGGGGIDFNGEDVSVKGKNESTVTGNIATKNGGGINCCGEKEQIDGLTIKSNLAEKNGGGIYTTNEGITLSDLTIRQNSAKAKGSGIYIEDDENAIVSCDIQNNHNQGVYVEKDVDVGFKISGLTTIKNNEGGNLTLQDESTRVSVAPKKGSEIYIGYTNYARESFIISPFISGLFVDGAFNDIDARKYLKPDNSDYVVAYIYESKTQGNIMGQSVRANCLIRKSAFSEYEAIGYEILEDDLVRVKKKISEAGPEVIGTVSAGGDDYTAGTNNVSGRYSMIKGLVHREMTESGSVDKENLFYYSDGLFYGDPYKFNDHLATLSWSLAFGGTYLRLGGKDPEAYKYKHTGARQFLADLGCPDQNIYVNDNNKIKPGKDTIGVTIGSKNLKRYNSDDELEDTGDILIPITVRGGGYENEWASNVTLGSGTERDGEAQGFSEAADQVMSAVEYYINKYSLADELEAGKVKFWLSGFSRAGATANITSKRLVEKYADGTDGKNNQVFSYPCEAAKGGTDKAEKLEGEKKKRYYCIHNMVNSCDVVPYVGPAEMGFKRYGVDHYIPGTATEEVSSDQEAVIGEGSAGIYWVTTYHDNKPLRTKLPGISDSEDTTYKEYKTRRSEMIKYLGSIDSELNFNDFFMPRGVSFAPPQYGYAGSYEGAYLDDFLADFMAFLQAHGLQRQGRKGYSVNVTKINGKEYTTLEKAARDVMSSDSLSELTGNTSSITDNLSYIAPFSSDISAFELYRNVVGEWKELDEKDRLRYMNYFWGLIKDSGALKSLPAGEVAQIEKNLPTLINTLLYYLDGDWDAYPDSTDHVFPTGKRWANVGMTSHFLMYSLTLYSHMDMILANHNPELNMAWCRTYDSWFNEIDDRNTDYKDALAEYEVAWGGVNGKPVDGDSYRVAAPSAAVETGAGTGEQDSDYDLLDPEDKDANNLKGTQKILLEVGNFNDAEPGNGNVIGEAIYYDLYDITRGEEGNQVDTIEKEQLYRGGITLQDDESAGQTKKYKINAYARSYGVHSEPVTYYVNVESNKHTVAIFNLSTESSGIQRYYSEGEKVTLSAVDRSGDRQFYSWTITDDANSSAGNDVTELLLGGGDDSIAGNRTITFTMPEAGSTVGDYTWDKDYSLTVKQNNFQKIKKITISDLKAPAALDNLDDIATISFDSDYNDEELQLPISWTYSIGENTSAAQQAGTEAYKQTIYTATLTVPQDLQNRRVFAANDDLTAVFGNNGSGQIDISKSSTDGSVTLKITFDETGTEGKVKPEDHISLRIRPFDLNKNIAIHEYDQTVEDVIYMVRQNNTILITAPEVSDMQFKSWNLEGSGIELEEGYEITDKTIKATIPDNLSDDELSIKADYVAVVNEVHASIQAPVLGEELPGADKAAINVRISESYEVDPANIEVVWTPEDDKARYMTYYTATIMLSPDQSGNIRVRKAGTEGDYETYNVNDLVFADTLQVTCNEDDDAPYDTDMMALLTIFDSIKYKVTQVTQPGSVGELENGSGQSDVAAALPKTTTILLDDGTEREAAIEWQAPVKTSESDDTLEESIWSAEGTITLPNDIENKDEIDLSVTNTVTVKAAEAVRMPDASVPSGTYIADQVVSLTTDTEDADIWYTTDGSDPFDTDNDKRKQYNGEQIYVTRNDDSDSVTIRAYAAKEGMRKSGEALLEYEFSKEIPVPDSIDVIYDGTAKTGVSGSTLYTLETADENVKINKNGDATAVNVGTYNVTAKIKEGLKWKTTDDEGEDILTTDDQVLTFTIAKADLSKIATIQVKNEYYTLDDLKKDVKVVAGDGTVLDKSIYDIAFAQKSDGSVIITVTGKGNYEGSLTGKSLITSISRKKQMGADGTAYGNGAAIEALDAAIAKLRSEKDPKGTKYAPIKLKSTKQTKKSVKLAWKKAKGAKKYVLYGTKCGKSNKYMKLAGFGASKRSYTVKKIITSAGKKTSLKKATYYKFLIVALDSKNNVVSTSKIIHAATKGKLKKAANAKKVVVKASINKTGKKLKKPASTSAITLRAGSTPKKLVKATTLKASFTKAKKSKVSKHVSMRFESSNAKIAAVNSKGRITAKKKGKCKIYVYAQNGLCKVIKVVVK